MTARVLFVDDESRVLQGLRRTLFVSDAPWQCDFADSGASALQMMGSVQYDAVVTDMSMQPMDGAELLRQVREWRPGTLRFVLSGHVETDAAIRALQVAQQWLSKPCDTRTLIDAIQSGIAVQRRLSDPVVRTTLGRLRTLPAAPQIYVQVSAALLHPNCDARRIASILMRDPALAANVLHLAHSAFFSGTGRQAADLNEAVIRVGLSAIADLVLATEVFDSKSQGPAADALRHRALRASRLASRIAGGRADAGFATTAALLADIGYLLPGIDAIDVTNASEPLSERAHAELGASLLALWALPLPIVEAVAYHHTPALIPRGDFGIHGIVHVSTALANDLQPDMEFLEKHGMSHQVEHWQALNHQISRC